METRIKKTFVCRNVAAFNLRKDVPRNYALQDGDVGIFEVLHIGKHSKIQADSKQNITIVEGDHIMAAFGTRYATAQIEGYLPDHIDQELHILGAGGTVGVVRSMHAAFEDIGPTSLRLIGLAVNPQGEVINTKKIEKHRMIGFKGKTINSAKVILSLGSSMDSGKTTSAAYLVHGLKKQGKKVAFIKLTGTIFSKDCDLVFDLGADMVADFGEFGFPSTYMCDEKELLDLYASLLKVVMHSKPDYIVMEIADGLYERETKMLLTNPRFISTIDGVMFSAADSLAAINGVHVLNQWDIYPDCLSGLFTASPLLIREVKENTDVPVFNIQELGIGVNGVNIFESKMKLAMVGG
ncbi:MAG: hypothetical protein IPP15_06205 [Saprospiraceae bacterium]|uniref:DUF1611 domain-containing protein n=1 Tax=Candidatus Opimibacter skivensis TaxID=2982028 RepID=A0A9D7SW63_9BACT|nr:hypothetical protein [Candidatus Opimibacter skivensis]